MKKNIKEKQKFWYVITASARKENVGAQNIKAKIYAQNFRDDFEDLKIINEEVTEIKEYTLDEYNNSKRKMSDTETITWESILNSAGEVTGYKRIKKVTKNAFPGYIFIKVHMSDELWFLIRNTSGITGIIGSSGKNTKPIPVSDMEMVQLLESVNKQPLTDEQKEEGTTNIVVEDDIITVEKTEYVAHFHVGNDILFKMNPTDEEYETGRVMAINKQKGTDRKSVV